MGMLIEPMFASPKCAMNVKETVALLEKNCLHISSLKGKAEYQMSLSEEEIGINLDQTIPYKKKPDLPCLFNLLFTCCVKLFLLTLL